MPYDDLECFGHGTLLGVGKSAEIIEEFLVPLRIDLIEAVEKLSHFLYVAGAMGVAHDPIL